MIGDFHICWRDASGSWCGHVHRSLDTAERCAVRKCRGGSWRAWPVDKAGLLRGAGAPDFAVPDWALPVVLRGAP